MLKNFPKLWCKILIYSLIWCMGSKNSWAQISNIYQAFYQDYHLSPVMINPAYSDENKINGSLHYKSFNSQLSVIKALLGQVNYSLNEKHGLGIRFNTEREGAYFSRDRMHLRYRLRTKLSRYDELAGGIDAGLVSYRFGASSASPGGASAALDLTFGTIYYHKAHQFGLAIHHIPQQVLQPIDYQFKLTRYYEFHYLTHYRLTNGILFSPYLRYRHTEETFERFAEVSLTFQEKERKWQLGLDYIWDLGLAPIAGVRIYTNRSKTDEIHLNMNYFFSFLSSRNTTFTSSQYEISIIYTAGKK